MPPKTSILLPEREKRNVIFLMKPVFANAEKPVAPSVKPGRWLMGLTKTARVKKWFLLTFFISLISLVLVIAQCYLLATIVDAAYIHRMPLSSLWLPLIFLLLCFMGRAVCVWLKNLTSFQLGAQVRSHLRQLLTEHLLQLSPQQLSQLSSGAVSSVMIEQVEAVQNFFARYYPQMIFAVLFPVIIAVVVWPYNWLSGLILIVTAPLIPLFMALVGMGAAALNRKHFQALARMGAHFLDILQGMATLKVFNQAKAQDQTIFKTSDNYRLRTMSVLRVAFLSSAVLEFFSSLAIALIATCLGLTLLGYMSWGDYGHSLTLFSALFILLLAPEFYLPLKELGVYYHDRAEAVGAAEEILSILTQPILAKGQGRKKITLGEDFLLHASHLSFSYHDAPALVLKNLDFELRAGQTIAIVGPSGAGKSTLLHMLCGFMLPSSGALKINEIDFAQLDLQAWRENISWLGQHPKLLAKTVYENILLARPQASRKDIETAAHQAQILTFLKEKRQGLHTVIGEQNAGLSGGQAQRVALARAFLRRSPLLLLDEPTASLDKENQRAVMKAIAELRAQATTVIVTHHLETIQQADGIWVLEKGQIVQKGNFEQLKNVPGLFKKLLDAKETFYA